MSVGRREVLVASETASANNKITESLDDSGFEVSIITTPEACLSKIGDDAPVLVFLSLSSPGIDAPELLEGIRKLEAELPVILMADEQSVAQVVPLLGAGATDYLLFPVADPSLVRYTVKRSIERRQETRRRKRSERDLKRLNRALVDSLKVLERDQQAGLRVQQGMMPESPFVLDSLTLSHRIVPSVILSGDFIDYFELPDRRLLFYIADVSGHGTSGAIITVLLKSLSTRLYNEMEELGLANAGEMLGWFNRELLACGLEQHVTMFLGVIDKNGRTLRYANAAHFPAAILSTPKSTQYLEMGGLPLGIYDTAGYRSREVVLPESFTLVMFSDGVFEILSEETLRAKEEYLLSLVKCGGDIEVLADHLGLGEVKEVPDDIAVFTVARAG
jgi:sigma-B regulation protein RsbU (phosphoserine phosphatase)